MPSRITDELEALEQQAGLTFTDYQVDALIAASQQQGPQQRLCLYYKTGAGKSYTALACLRVWGEADAVVIAPPSTHPAWVAAGKRFGVRVECMSHAKFRMKTTKISRHRAIIADEMHLFGGHGGKGWQKLDRLAAGIQAPLILASATPSYNDADRVYCIQHVLDPLSCRGGFLQFLYTHCITEADPFSMTPKVLGFQKFPGNADTEGAAAYLASLPYVQYLPDDLVYTIDEVDLYTPPSAVLTTYGYVESKHRILASIIEEKHTRIQEALISRDGLLDMGARDLIEDILEKADGPVLIFAAHSTVAEAAARWLALRGTYHGIVTGKTPGSTKDQLIAMFNAGKIPVLIGTASLATGTDGMDKVCNTLIILDDTEDASLRRQLIGRIMPRGVGSQDASNKKVYRLNLTP